MSSTDNTGEGGIIGIYDTGMDSTVSDFREMVGGVSTLRRALTGTPWQTDGDGHGTHVAGIAGGNGWLSRSDESFARG
jgi:subtilisin family serine protease